MSHGLHLCVAPAEAGAAASWRVIPSLLGGLALEEMRGRGKRKAWTKG
mgnify:CR=1 FL=1